LAMYLIVLNESSLLSDSLIANPFFGGITSDKPQKETLRTRMFFIF
jgi:hypothetical protein